MPLDRYADIWNRVLLRAPDIDPFIAQDFVRNSWRRLAERRRWSWLIEFGQFIAPNAYVTGTVDVTQGSTTVTGTGTAWTTALINQQFRIGLTAPIYTIVDVDAGAQTMELSYAYGGPTASATSYRIYQCYFPVPEDFRAFLSLWDPQMNWQLYLNIKQEEINMIDSQRATMGQAFWVSYYDTSIYYDGHVDGTPGVPRYELYPHVTGRTYPFLYEKRVQDLDDVGITLPRLIRGDILLEMSLAEAAAYPGTGAKPNAYFNKLTFLHHDQKAEFLIDEAERQDDETDMQNLMKQYNIPSAYAVPWGDSRWLQTHLAVISG